MDILGLMCPTADCFCCSLVMVLEVNVLVLEVKFLVLEDELLVLDVKALVLEVNVWILGVKYFIIISFCCPLSSLCNFLL